MPIDRNAFLAEFCLGEDLIEESALSWEVLEAIHGDFESRRREYEDAANGVADRLRRLAKVHSTRLRVKSSESLVAKILRKYSHSDCGVETYRSRVFDLAGVRALHLYREDWPDIHAHIASTWELAEAPKAFIREGDLRELYEGLGCTTEPSIRGYRSVHYLVKTSPTTEELIVEIQVRTLFAEGWSEIDHQVAYPHNTRDEVLEPYLSLFNRVAGLADEMATVLRLVQTHRREVDAEFKSAIKDRDDKLAELKCYIENLERANKLSDEERMGLERRIENLTRSDSQAGGRFSVLADGSRSSIDNLLTATAKYASMYEQCGKCGTNYLRALQPFCPKCGPGGILSAIRKSTGSY